MHSIVFEHSLTGPHDCRHCAAVLRPLAGDCCVFCSFGDVPCPPIQEAKANGTVAGCCG
ncbi:GDCCVxC domain-containing (seleno)protein [Sphingobium olei]|uniref:GDCCVxC domain-containing (seleno)protein n=1 Tax=Sphingobium olei TaxID=420955 RepID=UPI003D1DDFEC